VIAYSVNQRTREIGVRMALGAQRSAVSGMVLREALRLVVIGIGAGVLGSLATAGLLRPLLFGVRPWDATTVGGVAVLLGVAAMLASYLPARRAASVNPVEALRAEEVLAARAIAPAARVAGFASFSRSRWMTWHADFFSHL
jgi:ABC-type antimicrobial peptide transport system permease subunit